MNIETKIEELEKRIDTLSGVSHELRQLLDRTEDFQSVDPKMQGDIATTWLVSIPSKNQTPKNFEEAQRGLLELLTVCHKFGFTLTLLDNAASELGKYTKPRKKPKPLTAPKELLTYDQITFEEKLKGFVHVTVLTKNEAVTRRELVMYLPKINKLNGIDMLITELLIAQRIERVKRGKASAFRLISQG
jgi:hypothetical protein